ncbi:MAG: neutral zinc metallopeptidase [Planctomycetes bacterium]|nr:neutral zinc metallopeptidase [Planctomycetota bacterium]
MRWKNQRRSENVEDRRGQRVAGPGKIGLGLGGIVIALVATYFGIDPQVLQKLLGTATGGGGAPGRQVEFQPTAEEQELADMVKAVLGSTEDVWHPLFRAMGKQYQEPKLVLFSGAVDSACGRATASVGPFYCPGDDQVYIDLSFYEDLRKRLGAPGDFAQAYVIAHEVGHHIQNLLGISDRLHRAHGKVSEAEYNQLSVRLELQADFLAGVWAHHAKEKFQLLEEGDLEEALGAANAIGDDRLQREARGYVVPDSFTHGTSEQRVRWFLKGFRTGDFEQGDTFSAREL